MNRKAMYRLRFYLAQEIYHMAVEKGEKYVEKGLPVIPIIRTFVKDLLGYEIQARQARTYAARLAEKTSHIEVYRHSGRGQEWRVRLLKTSPQWIYKIQNDRIAKKEKDWAEEKKRYKEARKETKPVSGDLVKKWEEVWKEKKDEKEEDESLAKLLPITAMRMRELHQLNMAEFCKPDAPRRNYEIDYSPDSLYARCQSLMCDCYTGQARVLAYEILHSPRIAENLTNKERERLWEGAGWLDEDFERDKRKKISDAG